MTEEFFAREAPRASGTNTLISVVILTVVAAILAALSSLISGALQAALMSSEDQGMLFATAGIGAGSALCGGLIGGLIGFYLGNGITYLGARIFGGTGSDNTQIYLVSLFAVPVGIVTGALGMIPCLGALVALAVSIYSIILNVRVVKVVHTLTTGRAVAAILVPPLVVMVVFGCLTVVLLTLLGPASGDVFEEIQYELMQQY